METRSTFFSIQFLPLVIIGCAICLPSHGQDLTMETEISSPSTWSISPQVGFVMTDFRSSEDSLAMDPNAGVSYGLNVEISSLSRYWNLLSGIHYSHSRASGTSQSILNDTDIIVEQNFELKRINIPIIAKVFPFENKQGLFTQIGMMINYQLSGLQSSTTTTRFRSPGAFSGDTVTRLSEDMKPEGELKPWVADALIGLGYEAHWGSYQLSAEVHYQHGLNGLSRNSSDLRAHSFYSLFGFGYLFP